MIEEDKIRFMREAIKQAKIAFKKGEIPIGAVIVKDGKIIARGRNKREEMSLATAHAEIIAINAACKKLKDWRLTGCEMFVTIEPCVMCAGAILNARMKKVYFGAEELKDGALVNAFSVLKKGSLNWSCPHEGGLLASECATLMVDFFKARRKISRENS